MKHSPARIWWKAYYRSLRIAQREAMKAMRDAVFCGTGWVVISGDGELKHIPVAETIARVEN